MNSRALSTPSVTPHAGSHAHGGASLAAALSALVIWGGLAGGGAWLVLQGLHPAGVAAIGPTPSESVAAVSVDRLTRVLSAAATSAPGQAKALAQAATPGVQVLGVVATASGAGAVLLRLGAEPPRPFAVGDVVPGMGVVLSVTPQTVTLGEAGRVTRTLQPPVRPAGTP